MDNNAKVGGQKLNELDAMKVSFVQLLVFLWRDNDFDIYRDQNQRPESLRDAVYKHLKMQQYRQIKEMNHMLVLKSLICF